MTCRVADSMVNAANMGM